MIFKIMSFVLIIPFGIHSQTGRNFKVTEYGILNYADSKNIVTEDVLKDKDRMDKIKLRLS